METWLTVLICLAGIICCLLLLKYLAIALEIAMYLALAALCVVYGVEIDGDWGLILGVVGGVSGFIMVLVKAYRASSASTEEAGTIAPPEKTPAPSKIRKGPRLQMMILAVSDLPAAVAFYRKAFGWSTQVHSQELVEFKVPGETGLAVYRRENFGKNIGQVPATASGPTGTELYLSVPDLPTAIKNLEAAGARVLSPATLRDWGDVVAYFADPDENVIAVSIPATLAK